MRLGRRDEDSDGAVAYGAGERVQVVEWYGNMTERWSTGRRVLMTYV